MIFDDGNKPAPKPAPRRPDFNAPSNEKRLKDRCIDVWHIVEWDDVILEPAEAVEHLQNCIAAIPDDVKGAKLVMHGYEGEIGGARIYIGFETLETDEELAERQDNARRWYEQQANNERQEFERLKKKFEPEARAISRRPIDGHMLFGQRRRR